MNRQTTQGFTLIELMIVVTIVAILAIIAYPSYQSFIHKTRLEAARSDLMTDARAIEKSYAKNHTFVGLTSSILTANKSKDFYTISFNGLPSADNYSLVATPTANEGSPDVLLYNDGGELLLCHGKDGGKFKDCGAY